MKPSHAVADGEIGDDINELHKAGHVDNWKILFGNGKYFIVLLLIVMANDYINFLYFIINFEMLLLNNCIFIVFIYLNR